MSANKSKRLLIPLIALTIGLVGAVITLAVLFTTREKTPEPTPTTTESPRKPINNYGRPGLSGALVDYVYREDDPPVYDWFIYRTVAQAEIGVTSYLVNLTSQRWHDEAFSDHPIWYHNFVIHIPDNILYPTAGYVYVTSGRNDGSEADLNNRDIRRTAEFAGATGIPAACLRQIPNQPVMFMNDGTGRSEDDLIAWTWRRYYNDTFTSSQDPDILARWPMIKAFARAMDAMTELGEQVADITIDKYMVGGASKRGWTAWLTGAVDRRVVAMVPVVLSCLNMVENFRHYWQSFGGWPFALFDYHQHGIMERMESPQMGEVIFYVDPYEYRHWMNIPKYLISGASDEFFLLTDFDYFYDSLPGENYMWIIENSGHNAASNGPHAEEAWRGMQTFFISVLEMKTKPTYDTHRSTNSSGGYMRVTTSEQPVNISAWSALSVTPPAGVGHRRDWRLAVLNEAQQVVPSNIVWTEKAVAAVDSTTYEVFYDEPTEGYLAFFIKMTFDAFDGRTYTYSTKAQVTPDVFPFQLCNGAECQGNLV